MALVRSVTAASTAAGSRFIVRGSMSTKTGVAPREAIAVAVAEKVKLGTMTSSPRSRRSRIAASSSAWVQEVVRSAPEACVRSSSHSVALRVKSPSPCQDVVASEALMFVYSMPAR